MFPLFVDLVGKPCLVVGGGPVGLRKAAKLLDAGAVVRLVCLQPRPPHLTAPALGWVQRPYAAADLDGARLVVAAATPEVDRQVAADCQARGIWINCASTGAIGDVIFPASASCGAVTVAVGTCGAAPALAAAVRDWLVEQMDPAFAAWAGLVVEMRGFVMACLPDSERRRLLLCRLADAAWLEPLRRHGTDEVRRAMLAEVAALAPAPTAPV